MVHRDVKTKNVVKDDATGDFILIDFGCAQMMENKEGPEDATNKAAGTKTYWAPEVWALYNAEEYPLLEQKHVDVWVKKWQGKKKIVHSSLPEYGKTDSAEIKKRHDIVKAEFPTEAKEQDSHRSLFHVTRPITKGVDWFALGMLLIVVLSVTPIDEKALVKIVEDVYFLGTDKESMFDLLEEKKMISVSCGDPLQNLMRGLTTFDPEKRLTNAAHLRQHEFFKSCPKGLWEKGACAADSVARSPSPVVLAVAGA